MRYRELERIHARADFAYRPSSYGGQVTLFRAREQPAAFAGAYALGWESVELGGLHVVNLPGSHAHLIEQPMLAAALRAELDVAESRVAEPTRPQ
jgi:thioesterase domain-containing protein